MKNLLMAVGLLASAFAYSAPTGCFLEDAASEPAQKTSDLPEILLIGDSIRQLYCPYVAEALRGQAEVKWPARENCQNTQHVLTNLSRWRGLVASPKVVQFNCGHWDAAHWDGDDEPLTSVEEYAGNIRKIIRRIRRYWPEAKKDNRRTWAKKVFEIAEYKGSGHGGGDLALVRDFIRAVDAHDEKLLSSSLAASVESHVMGFACEKSRLSGHKETVEAL